MKARFLIDAGPLVAALNPRDRNHEWTRARFEELPGPFATCEAVLSEASFLLDGKDALMALFEEGHGEIVPLDREMGALRKLMAKYRSVPMSLADAGLVRLSELYPRLPVVTLDTDFLVYRRNRSQQIPLVAPFVDQR